MEECYRIFSNKPRNSIMKADTNLNIYVCTAIAIAKPQYDKITMWDRLHFTEVKFDQKMFFVCVWKKYVLRYQLRIFWVYISLINCTYNLWFLQQNNAVQTFLSHSFEQASIRYDDKNSSPNKLCKNSSYSISPSLKSNPSRRNLLQPNSRRTL